MPWSAYRRVRLRVTASHESYLLRRARDRLRYGLCPAQGLSFDMLSGRGSGCSGGRVSRLEPDRGSTSAHRLRSPSPGHWSPEVQAVGADLQTRRRPTQQKVGMKQGSGWKAGRIRRLGRGRERLAVGRRWSGILATDIPGAGSRKASSSRLSAEASPDVPLLRLVDQSSLLEAAEVLLQHVPVPLPQ
jgi:hypothetical protein